MQPDLQPDQPQPPLQVSGRDFHNEIGLCLKIVDTGRVVEVMHHGKIRARLVPA